MAAVRPIATWSTVTTVSRVPPEKPAYQIRRVWLSAEEEAGYYYGFANEGCGRCATSPMSVRFPLLDWAHYVAVNRKFAKAVVSESRTRKADRSGAGLSPRAAAAHDPRGTAERHRHHLLAYSVAQPGSLSPSARGARRSSPGCWAAASWASIPSSTATTLSTPWIASLKRAWIAKTSPFPSAASSTAVRRYPISIAWPPEPRNDAERRCEQCRGDVRQANALPAGHKLGIGMDRLDYTKGIVERFRAIERLLELNPEWIGRFSLIQIAAPTRSSIDEYQHHEAQVRAMATQINDRFGRDGLPPIVLKVEHHDAQAGLRAFSCAPICASSAACMTA
jgi:trehalose 6-phosphate synthase